MCQIKILWTAKKESFKLGPYSGPKFVVLASWLNIRLLEVV